MFRRILRILCIVFLSLSVLCFGVLTLSFFPDNSFNLGDVINASRTEYRMIAVYGLAVLVGFVCIFIVSVLFRQFGKKWMQVTGKVFSLVSAALALCVSFTSVALLCFPRNSLSADFEYDSSSYSAYRFDKTPPPGAILSEWNMTAKVLSFYDDESSERTRVRFSLGMDNPNMYRISCISLRCIACDADGSSFGAFYFPLKDEQFLPGRDTTVTCTFPTLPEHGVSFIFELTYFDENGKLCYCFTEESNPANE